MFTGLIKNNKLFYKITESDINLLLTSENIITKNKGDVIYKEGEPGESVYLVIAGEVCIAKERFLGRVKKENKSANEFFGEESYLEKIPRPFTAYAAVETQLVQLEKAKLDQICSVNQQFLNNVKRTPDEPIIENEKIEEKIEVPAVMEVTPAAETFAAEAVTGSTENTGLVDNPVTVEIPEPVDNPAVMENFEAEEPLPVVEIPEAAEISAVTENPVLEPTAAEIDTAETDNTAPVLTPEEPVAEEPVLLNIPSVEEPVQDDNPVISGPEIEQDTVEKNTTVIFDINEKEIIPVEELDKLPEIDFELGPDYHYEAKNDGLYEIPGITIDEVPVTPVTESIELNAEEKPVENIDIAAVPVLHEQPVDAKPKDELSAEDLHLIIKTAQSVNSKLKIEDVLQSIVDAARNLTEADRGTLYIVDKEKSEIWSKILDGKELKEIRLKFGEGVAGWVVNNKETVNIKDVQYDHRFNDQVDHTSGYQTKSMLCFPVCNKFDEVVGVLQLLNSKKGEFTPLDEEFLKVLSINAALALENAELVEKLLQSERITSLGKMANFLIQDIKKPVLVSKRYAEHLKTKNLPADVNQVLDMMLEQLSHVADLVQTTSSYSEGKSMLQSVPLQLNEVLGEILSKLESYVTIHNCKLVKDFDTSMPVKLDRKEFYQCCMHLVRNACDAMPEGGVVTVSTKKLSVESIAITVKDNGLGIPDSLKDKIFEPFMSHGKKEGTGLGLSITKKIVEDHGGTITVESDLGEGAAFIITLPVAF